MYLMTWRLTRTLPWKLRVVQFGVAPNPSLHLNPKPAPPPNQPQRRSQLCWNWKARSGEWWVKGAGLWGGGGAVVLYPEFSWSVQGMAYSEEQRFGMRCWFCGCVLCAKNPGVCLHRKTRRTFPTCWLRTLSWSRWLTYISVSTRHCKSRAKLTPLQ